MSANFREDGLLLYKDSRYSAALETFLAEETDPAEDPELAYYMALCHARLSETEEAVRLLRQVLRQDSHMVRLYQSRMLLSWLLVELDEIEAAEQQLREVLQEGFESPQTWSALGYCQWRRNRTDLALESYREALNSMMKIPMRQTDWAIFSPTTAVNQTKLLNCAEKLLKPILTIWPTAILWAGLFFVPAKPKKQFDILPKPCRGDRGTKP